MYKYAVDIYTNVEDLHSPQLEEELQDTIAAITESETDFYHIQDEARELLYSVKYFRGFLDNVPYDFTVDVEDIKEAERRLQIAEIKLDYNERQWRRLEDWLSQLYNYQDDLENRIHKLHKVELGLLRKPLFLQVVNIQKRNRHPMRTLTLGFRDKENLHKNLSLTE